MELKLLPSPKNEHPLGGFTIHGSSAEIWIKELQELQLSLRDIRVFPIPDLTPNSVWGCLVVHRQPGFTITSEKHDLCQMVNSNFFIPEKSTLLPHSSLEEIEKLFSNTVHIFHPVFGLVELTSEWNILEILDLPMEKKVEVIQPTPGSKVPKTLNRIFIQPLPPEETFRLLDEKLAPKPDVQNDAPLSSGEKARLAVYKALFSKGKSDQKQGAGGNAAGEPGALLKFMDKLLGSKNSNGKGFADRMFQDMDELERRNDNELQKFLKLMENNPSEALKYAMPLGNDAGRGGMLGEFQMSQRWKDFSMSSSQFGGGNGPGASIGQNTYQELMNSYRKLAQDFLNKGEYEKAGFVYLKLLRSYHEAAAAFEKGKYWSEAASIYEKYCHNKLKAAECYENGLMFHEAIELYKQLNNDEKVADLYLKLNRKKEAFIYYEKVISQNKNKGMYLYAANIYFHKMKQLDRGNELLLEGWKLKHQAAECLTLYFSHFNEQNELRNEIEKVYAGSVDVSNKEYFLQVIRPFYKKDTEQNVYILDLAYEIISSHAPINRSVVNELKRFKDNDVLIARDVNRYLVDP